jgi:hypothetical protein
MKHKRTNLTGRPTKRGIQVSEKEVAASAIGCGCLTIIALVVIRILSLVWALADLLTGHPTHETLDILAIIFLW